MKKPKKKVQRSLERKLAKELTAEELNNVSGGAIGTISCSGGCADD